MVTLMSFAALSFLVTAYSWIGLSVVVAVAANTRGRDSTGWFIGAILFSPLIMGLMLLALLRRGHRGDHHAADRRSVRIGDRNNVHQSHGGARLRFLNRLSS